MKKLKFSLLLILTTIFSMAFLTKPVTPVVMFGTKWISPINDNCFDSLCFTSESNVMYYSCEENIYVEIGYKIKGDNIEIEAYSKSNMDPGSKMVLVEDNGVLKQLASQNNRFPRNFIKVPEGECK